MDTEPLNIYQRMHAVMKDIGYVQKSDKTVNNQYRFVTHDAVTALVRKALVEHGIVATTDILNHTQEGNRTEVDLMVRFVNVDEPSDSIAVKAFGYGIDPQDKGPGKAISYAVKYAYLKAFALETGDDPERDNIDHDPGANKKAPPKDGLNGAEVCKTELDRMTPAEQEVIRANANTILDLHNADMKQEASDHFYAIDSQEKQMAVWAVLQPHSAVRSAVKKLRRQDALLTQA